MKNVNSEFNKMDEKAVILTKEDGPIYELFKKSGSNKEFKENLSEIISFFNDLVSSKSN